jgi:hypothetical protein
MITSIFRSVAFFQNDPLVDGTWKSVIFLRWTIIEPGVYLVAACLPCYRPLVRLVLDRVRSVAPSHDNSGNLMPDANDPRVREQRRNFEMSAYGAGKADKSRESDGELLV